MFTIENNSESEEEDYNEECIHLLKYKTQNHYNQVSSDKQLIEIFKIGKTNTNIIEEEDSETKSQSFPSPSQNPTFNVTCFRMRGRKSKKQKKTTHKSSNFDNLQTKIQVHFINFIINLSNDMLREVYGKKNRYNFKQIEYKLKKVINHENVQKLKSSSIKEILKMKITPKNKKSTSYNNIMILDEVCKNPFLDKFFDMKYLEVFNKYYFSEDKIKDKIEFEGKQITLSTKTKTFYHLLQKYEGLKNLLIDTAKSVYFYGYDKLIDKNSFKNMKNEGFLIDLKE